MVNGEQKSKAPPFGGALLFYANKDNTKQYHNFSENKTMRQYLDLLQYVLDHGAVKGDRAGTGTRSVFGYQIRFDLSAGFPLVTTKRYSSKGIIYELLWFLRGGEQHSLLEGARGEDLG